MFYLNPWFIIYNSMLKVVIYYCIVSIILLSTLGLIIYFYTIDTYIAENYGDKVPGVSSLVAIIFSFMIDVMLLSIGIVRKIRYLNMERNNYILYNFFNLFSKFKFTFLTIPIFTIMFYIVITIFVYEEEHFPKIGDTIMYSIATIFNYIFIYANYSYTKKCVSSTYPEITGENTNLISIA